MNSVNFVHDIIKVIFLLKETQWTTAARTDECYMLIKRFVGYLLMAFMIF